MKTMLLAVGGNSLIRAGEAGTIAEQRANAQRTAAQIVGLIRAGYRIVLTHGNGPQVGAALLRSERGASQVPGLPLDVCGASTQGEIGYLLQQSLEPELQRADLHVPVATVLTQCLVLPDDPSMKHPSKPIGPFYSSADAEERKRLFGWEIVEDAARGYRRVVPSPDPVGILELEVIRNLVGHGVLVIACGGGGIPVVWRDGRLQGVEAVIDKDHASPPISLLLLRTPTTFIWTTRNQPKARFGKSAPTSWTSTPGLAISRPATWAPKSNPCCAFCARAARKLLLLRARICVRRSSGLPAHTCSPIATVRKSSETLISKTKRSNSQWRDANARADYHRSQPNPAFYFGIGAERGDAETRRRVPAIHGSAAHGIIRAVARYGARCGARRHARLPEPHHDHAFLCAFDPHSALVRGRHASSGRQSLVHGERGRVFFRDRRRAGRGLHPHHQRLFGCDRDSPHRGGRRAPGRGGLDGAGHQCRRWQRRAASDASFARPVHYLPAASAGWPQRGHHWRVGQGPYGAIAGLSAGQV